MATTTGTIPTRPFDAAHAATAIGRDDHDDGDGRGDDPGGPGESVSPDSFAADLHSAVHGGPHAGPGGGGLSDSTLEPSPLAPGSVLGLWAVSERCRGRFEAVDLPANSPECRIVMDEYIAAYRGYVEAVVAYQPPAPQPALVVRVDDWRGHEPAGRGAKVLREIPLVPDERDLGDGRRIVHASALAWPMAPEAETNQPGTERLGVAS